MYRAVDLSSRSLIQGFGENTRRERTKDYKSGYRVASKIKDEGFEADLYRNTDVCVHCELYSTDIPVG
jgi:hypothetical protein